MKDNWYKDWFDSPYYHLLYRNRDDREAEAFIQRLCDHLQLKEKSKVWDIACGNGRHSQALIKRGFKVTGTDLSPKNIEAAAGTGDGEFYIHDMRHPFRVNYFDAALNLFTSFGYFETARDNEKVFTNIHASLKKGGLFVIDFFNAVKVRSMKFEPYTIKRDDIEFHVSKKLCSNFISKTINFEDMGRKFEFREKVELLEENDLRKLGNKAGFTLRSLSGNYRLDPFDAATSDRLILIFQK